MPTAYFVGLLFSLMLASAPLALAASPSPTAPDKTVAVEIDGALPGFSKEQLSAYVAEQMDATDLPTWHFAPESSGSQPADRVVWHFRLLPFAGGSVRYIGPALSKARDIFGVGRAIGIDAKIYLSGRYQASTFDQATVKGGPNDPALIEAIQKMTRTIISSALTEEAAGELKLAKLSATKSG